MTTNPIRHFSLFSYYDLLAFEDAIKESKWRKAMDVEIAAITMEKNISVRYYENRGGSEIIIKILKIIMISGYQGNKYFE